MRASPAITIVIPAFNAARTLQRAIASVLRQSIPIATEILVVDDASTDGTHEIASVIGPPVHAIRLKVNSGPGYARNAGIRHAAGTFVAFLDSDDFWHPEKLEIQYNYMVKSKADMTCTSAAFLERKEGDCFPVRFIKHPQLRYTAADLRALCNNNTIVTSSVMIRRSVLCGRRFPLVKNRQDLLFWASLLTNGVVACGIPQVLTYYDLDSKGISANKLRMLRANYYAYHQILKSRRKATCAVLHSALRNLAYRMPFSLEGNAIEIFDDATPC